jgi:hypothetical protein
MTKTLTGSKTTGEVVFPPEVIDAMSWAFDHVCERLAIPEAADAPREIIASRIVELAGKGEHDLERLRDEALKTLGELTRVP